MWILFLIVALVFIMGFFSETEEWMITILLMIASIGAVILIIHVIFAYVLR